MDKNKSQSGESIQSCLFKGRLLKPIYMYLLMTRSDFNISLDLDHLKDCHVNIKVQEHVLIF